MTTSIERTHVELSPSSSRESLNEDKIRAAELNTQDANWKKKSRESMNSNEDEEIELPGATSVNPNSAASTESSTIGSKGVSALARDARRLKTATLERMGKMLKLNAKSGVEKPDGSPSSASCEDTSRKQKFNSLTRMLKLTDKDGQGNTLTRILRRKAPAAEGDSPSNTPNKQTDEQARGIFSRLMGNFRGKHGFTKNVSSAENSPQKKENQELSKSASSSSLTEVNLESSCQLVDAQREA